MLYLLSHEFCLKYDNDHEKKRLTRVKITGIFNLKMSSDRSAEKVRAASILATAGQPMTSGGKHRRFSPLVGKLETAQ